MYASNKLNLNKIGGKSPVSGNAALYQIQPGHSKSRLVSPNYVSNKSNNLTQTISPYLKDVATTTDGLVTAKIDIAMARLEKVFHETMKVDANLQQDMLKLEKVYERKYNELYDRRVKLLAEIKKMSTTCVCPLAGSISKFWLEVIKAAKCMTINASDEKILAHLIDVRSKWIFEPTSRFELQFFFEPNDFIANAMLTKTYFLNCTPDEEDPVAFDGPEIFKCEGCEIDWKLLHLIPAVGKPPSFFDFFAPPTLPADTNHPHFDKINAVLEKDFEWGFYLKDKVIPKALKFFTGEIEERAAGSDTGAKFKNEAQIESDTEN